MVRQLLKRNSEGHRMNRPKINKRRLAKKSRASTWRYRPSTNPLRKIARGTTLKGLLEEIEYGNSIARLYANLTDPEFRLDGDERARIGRRWLQRAGRRGFGASFDCHARGDEYRLGSIEWNPWDRWSRQISAIRGGLCCLIFPRESSLTVSTA